MKKVLVFFIIVGIIVGIVIGANAVQLKENEEDLTPSSGEKLQSTEIINELSLALPEVDTLNPLRTKNSYVADVLKLIYEPLVSFDDENQIESSLAVNWAQRDDVTWIIKLRENVYFHGGEKFTATDVKYTINTLLNNEIQSKYFANVSNISSVDLIDENTLVITLKTKDTYFPSKLTFPIIPEYYFKNEGILNEDKANRPIGTGAYQYDSSNDSEIKIIFNKNWWKDSKAKLSTIYLKKYSTYNEAIKAFKSSDVDMIFTTIYNWKEKFGFIGVNSHTFESSKYEVIIPNTSKTILKESSVRKAVLSAINRENMISSLYGGNAYITDIPIASNSKYATPSMEYDIEKAKQMLINAGWLQTKNGWSKDGKNLAFNIIVIKDDSENLSIAKQIKQDLAEIQIKITINELAQSSFNDSLQKGNFDLALATLDIKNEYQIQDIVSTGSVYNYAHFSDEKMDGIINMMNASDGDVYANNMETFKQYYKSEMPYIGLFYKSNIILTNKSVKGEYKGTDFNPYRNIRNFCK